MKGAKWTALGVPVALLLLAFALRTLGLAAQSFWYDEGYSVMLARQDWGHIVGQTASLDFNTPLHYLLLSAWMTLGGTSEFSARLLSVFASLITVAVVAQLVRLPGSLRHRLPSAQWLALALMALSPVSVDIAQEARMYALESCFCALATVQLLRCLRRGSSGAWLWWITWNWAAFLTHIIGAVFFAAQALVVAGWWVRRAWLSRDQAKPFTHGRWMPLVAVCAAGLGMAAFVVYILSFGRAYAVTYDARLDLGSVLAQSLAAMALPDLLPRDLIVPAVLLVSGFTVVALIGAIRARNRDAVRLLAVAVAGLVAISIFCAYTGKFKQRYPAVVMPVLLAGMCAGLASWPSLAPATSFALVTGALSVVGLVALRTDAIYYNQDFRGAAAYIRQHIGPDEPTLLVAGHFAPVFEYYYGPSGWRALPDDPVLDVSHQLDYDSAVPATNEALSGKRGAWLLLWQDDIVDPTAVTQSLLRRRSIDLAPRLDSADFHGLRLQHYRFFDAYQPLPERLPELSATVQPTDRQRGLDALGCAQFDPTQAGAGFMEIACFWRVEPDSQLPSGTQVSVRLLNDKGEQVAQSDQPIAPKGLPYIPYPKPIASFYVFPLPANLPAGNYTVRVIPYTDVEQISPQVAVPVQVLP